jgi:hypothetical protein
MNKYDEELQAAESAAELAELEYQINKVLEVLED